MSSQQARKQYQGAKPCTALMSPAWAVELSFTDMSTKSTWGFFLGGGGLWGFLGGFFLAGLCPPPPFLII